MGVVFVSNDMLERWSPRDTECFVCGAHGGGNPCGNCREMAALALGGNAAAAAALAGFGADFAVVRSAVKAQRGRSLLERVADMGRAL
jgi:hypothetical protein